MCSIQTDIKETCKRGKQHYSFSLICFENSFHKNMLTCQFIIILSELTNISFNSQI